MERTWYVAQPADKQPPVKAKGGRMMALIDYRLRVTLNDGRQMTGQLLAFDTFMNLVLSNSTSRGDADAQRRNSVG